MGDGSSTSSKLDKAGQNPTSALLDRAWVGGATRQLFDVMAFQDVHVEDRRR